MSEDLKLRVLTDGDTRGLDKTARALDGLADDADRAEKSTKGLGEEVDKTSKKTEGLGRKSKQTKQDIVDLDRRIVELKASLKGLNDEYERSGKVDRKRFGADNRELSGLERMRKQISGLAGDVADLGKQAVSTGGKLADAGIPLISTIAKHPGVAAAAATVAIPAAIGVGATVGGAVTAGVGAGVAGLGIAGAALGSEKVRNEWAATAAEIKKDFLEATTSFEGPTIAAIAKIRGALRDVDMKKIFGDASKFVEPLAEGAAKAVRFIGQGVEYLVARGMPAISAVGDGVAEVGGAIKTALEKISDGGEGGAKALRDMFGVISDLIVLTGTWIGWFEDAYDAVDALGEKMKTLPQVDLMSKLFDPEEPKVIARTLDDMGTAADHAGGSVRYLSGGLSDMRSEANLANEAFDRLFGIMMDADTANLRVKQGLADLKEAMHDSGATRDEITEKVLRQIQALEDQRNAELATGDGSAAATTRINANYQSQLEQLKRMFPWLEGIIDKYEKLSAPLTKHITVVIDQVGDVSREGVISGGDQRTRVGAAFASGTPSAPPGWALVGEDGPELVKFSGGEQVYTAGQTSQMMSGGTSTGFGSGGRTVTFAGNTDTAFASYFMQLVREGLIEVN